MPPEPIPPKSTEELDIVLPLDKEAEEKTLKLKEKLSSIGIRSKLQENNLDAALDAFKDLGEFLIEEYPRQTLESMQKQYQTKNKETGKYSPNFMASLDESEAKMLHDLLNIIEEVKIISLSFPKKRDENDERYDAAKNQKYDDIMKEIHTIERGLQVYAKFVDLNSLKNIPISDSALNFIKQKDQYYLEQFNPEYKEEKLKESKELLGKLKNQSEPLLNEIQNERKKLESEKKSLQDKNKIKDIDNIIKNVKLQNFAMEKIIDICRKKIYGNSLDTQEKDTLRMRFKNIRDLLSEPRHSEIIGLLEKSLGTTDFSFMTNENIPEMNVPSRDKSSRAQNNMEVNKSTNNMKGNFSRNDRMIEEDLREKTDNIQNNREENIDRQRTTIRENIRNFMNNLLRNISNLFTGKSRNIESEARSEIRGEMRSDINSSRDNPNRTIIKSLENYTKQGGRFNKSQYVKEVNDIINNNRYRLINKIGDQKLAELLLNDLKELKNKIGEDNNSLTNIIDESIEMMEQRPQRKSIEALLHVKPYKPDDPERIDDSQHIDNSQHTDDSKHIDDPKHAADSKSLTKRFSMFVHETHHPDDSKGSDHKPR